MAHLTLAAGRRGPLAPSDLRRRLAALQAEGYHGAVTAALGPPDAAVFAEAGFRVIERLHLLHHPLDQLAAAGHPTHRARRRERPAIFAVDHAAFAPFWQLNETMLSEALTATRAVRWRVVRGPEGEVVGYAICGRSGTRGYVQRLAVHPGHQGQGVGRSLLSDGLRWCARRGAREALVNTQHGNHRSLRLYLGAGFVLQPGGLAVLRLDFGPASAAAPSAQLPRPGIVHHR
jgi:ribosomal protein S18 acetylase RimI-like enzyme